MPLIFIIISSSRRRSRNSSSSSEINLLNSYQLSGQMAAMKLVEFLEGMDRGGPQVIHQFSVQAKKSSCNRTSETPPPMSKSLIFGFLCARIKMGITISKCLLMIYSGPKTADATTTALTLSLWLWHRLCLCPPYTNYICIYMYIYFPHEDHKSHAPFHFHMLSLSGCMRGTWEMWADLVQWFSCVSHMGFGQI